MVEGGENVAGAVDDPDDLKSASVVAAEDQVVSVTWDRQDPQVAERRVIREVATTRPGMGRKVRSACSQASTSARAALGLRSLM